VAQPRGVIIFLGGAALTYSSTMTQDTHTSTVVYRLRTQQLNISAIASLLLQKMNTKCLPLTSTLVYYEWLQNECLRVFVNRICVLAYIFIL